jgi:AcrR family transcriptional regulator
MSRRSKGAEREQAVIDATVELIGEQGLPDLRVADVAARAGMSVGHVTYYFPSKSELLVRAIQQSEMSFQRQVTAALDQIDDPWQRFCTLIELASAEGPGDRGWLLWLEVWTNAVGNDQVAEVQRSLDAWWRSTMVAIVGEGVRRGAFECDNPGRATAVLSALTDGLSVQLALDGGLDRATVLDLIFDTARQVLGVRQ